MGDEERRPTGNSPVLRARTTRSTRFATEPCNFTQKLKPCKPVAYRISFCKMDSKKGEEKKERWSEREGRLWPANPKSLFDVMSHRALSIQPNTLLPSSKHTILVHTATAFHSRLQSDSIPLCFLNNSSITCKRSIHAHDRVATGLLNCLNSLVHSDSLDTLLYARFDH